MNIANDAMLKVTNFRAFKSTFWGVKSLISLFFGKVKQVTVKKNTNL